MSETDSTVALDAPTSGAEASSSLSLGDKLAVATLLAVLLGGAWQMFQSARQVAAADIPATFDAFWHGETGKALEKQLDAKLPERTTFIAGANGLRYLLLRGGGTRVRVGDEGWLYYTEELRFHEGAAANLTVRADLLAAAAKSLARDDVKLLVVLVPDKVRVVPEYYTDGIPVCNRSRYGDALAALHARGVAVVDILQALTAPEVRGEVFYRSDTHWNQAGAALAAQAVAAAVRELHVALPAASFATAAEGPEQERPGDLLRSMGLDRAPNFLRPLPDREIVQVTRQTTADEGGDLFGDGAVPVVLTGTSFSHRANFHGALQQALGAKVLNVAKDGGGFLQATTAYLKDEAFRTAKPKVLVWEVPERFVDAKLEGEVDWLRTVGLRP